MNALPYILIVMSVFIVVLLVLIGVTARRIQETDARIDQLDNRIRELLTRIDILDKSLGDLDIKSAKGIEVNKTRIAEFKKEQNNRCDKLAKRLEVLEDAAGNIESIGNLAEEVRSYGRRLKELDALVEQSTLTIEASSELAMTNQANLQKVYNDLRALRMENAG